MSQLLELARPFPSDFVQSNPSGGGSYVAQGIIKQRLLLVVGPYDFELVQVIRGFVPGKAPNPNGTSARAKAGTPDLSDAIVGAVCRLTCEIDGKTTRVEDCGDCEEPHNWPHDGARLKDAMTDALKRCAMQKGLGLHLWCPDDKGGYFLYERLKDKELRATGGAPPVTSNPEGDGVAPTSGVSQAVEQQDAVRSTALMLADFSEAGML